MTPGSYTNSTVEVEFKGIAQGYQIQPVDELFSVEVAAQSYGNEIVNRRIPEMTTPPTGFDGDGWEANDGIVGQYAPVVFGASRQVGAQLSNSEDEITEDSDGSGTTVENRELKMAEFVVGSKVDDLENHSISTSFYVTDSEGVYRAAIFGADGDPTTLVLRNIGSVSSDWSGGSQSVFWAFPLAEFSTSDNFLVTHLTINLRGTSTSGAGGQISLQIAEKVAGDSIFYEIPGARCVWEKDNYQAEIAATSVFTLDLAVLEKAMIFKPGVNYYAIVNETSNQEFGASEVDFRLSDVESSTSLTAAGTKPIYSALVTDGVRSGWSIEGDEGVFSYAVAMAPLDCYGLRGLGEREVDDVLLAKYRAPHLGTIQTTDVLNRGITFIVDGLKDDSSGTYSGTANSLLENSFDITKMLWDKSGRSLSDWDTSRFSGARSAARDVAGVAGDAVTYRELAVQILSHTAAKICTNRNGTVSFWPYGLSGETANATITEDDGIIERIEVMGGEEIVNALSVAYDQRLVSVRAREVRGAGFWGGTLNREHADSQSIYGRREPAEELIGLSFLGAGVAAANSFIDQYFDEYAQESAYITVRLPYWLKNYRSLELWDIVILSHVDLPSIGGSASRQQAKPLSDFGAAESVDYFEGFGARDAKSVWCRVVERNPVYSATEGQAELVLVLRKINNLDRMI